jgi:iron complex transport system permease protein
MRLKPHSEPPPRGPRSGTGLAPSLKPRPTLFATVAVPALLLLVAILVSSGLGAVRLSFGDVLRALLHPAQAGDTGIILFTLRLPRVLAAGLAGAALSATGVLFQGLFRNPLADPFVLGASGGAALGGAIAIFLVPSLTFAGVGATELLAFAGALLAMVIVWSLARAGGHFAMENMLLAGFAFGTMLNAATSALEMRQEATNPGTRILEAWLHGQVTVPSWTQLSWVAIVEVAALLLALPLARQLNTLALSEEYAAQLGIRVQRLQMLVVVLGSLLTALAVSLGGLIGFVGLLVPHFLRLILGPDHFRLLPAASLCGAVFLIVADTIARTAFAPSEIPVGMLTAFLGAPAFLYLLNHRRRSSPL